MTDGTRGRDTRPGDPLPARVESAPPMLDDGDAEAIVEAARAALSPATRRSYRAAWGRFEDWAGKRGHEALPALPEIVALYLVNRAKEGASNATLAMARAAIRHHHAEANHANPCDTAGVRAVLRGLRRSAAQEGRISQQAAGLTSRCLEAIKRTAFQPRTGPRGRKETEEAAEKRGAVDIALASVMRDAMLRRSEAAALRWADVEVRSDGSARVNIRHSKSDQEGRGAVQFVGPPAARALRAIRPKDAAAEDRVFGLTTGRAISNRIAAMANAAGLEGHFSGHSPRVGMAQDLAAACTELPALMVAGRWKSSRMPAHYASAELAGRGAVARYYGMVGNGPDDEA